VKLRHEKKIPYSLPLRVPYALLTGSFERQEDAAEKKVLLRVKGLLPYILPFATERGVEHRGESYCLHRCRVLRTRQRFFPGTARRASSPPMLHALRAPPHTWAVRPVAATRGLVAACGVVMR
jgi:hypothetical protein